MACEDCNWILEPGKILHIRPTGDTSTWKIPVQFQSYTDEDASWETYEYNSASIPSV